MPIRIMTMDDYPAVHALWISTEGVGMRALDDSPEGVASFLARNPRTCFVAEEGGVVAGSILSGHDGRRGFIYHTAVSQPFQRHGLGKALAEAALSALAAEGIHKAALVVFQNNAAGNGFWESMGFSARTDLVYRNKSLTTENG